LEAAWIGDLHTVARKAASNGDLWAHSLQIAISCAIQATKFS
jgi:hypothetical protein